MSSPIETPAERITFRALLAGVLMAAALGIGVPYENLIISGSPMAFDYTTGAAVFLFFLFVLMVNPILGGLRRSWAFTSAELATVYIMGAIACTVPLNSLVGLLFSAISAGNYYATPENDWLNIVIPHIKPWLMVSDPQTINGFYQGASAGAEVPWSVWLRPLMHWFPLFVGFFGTIMAMMIFMRKQWINNERLLFPLVQVPIAMIGESGSETRGGISPFFKNGWVWLGVLIPILWNSRRALGNYFPMLSNSPVFYHLRLLHGAVVLPWSLNFAALGFGFLLTTKLSFSIWFLGLLTVFEEVVLKHLGILGVERLVYNPLGASYLAHQGTGALLMLALIVLWTARRHLGEAFRLAFGKRPKGRGRDEVGRDDDADGGGEVLTYRQTFLLLFVSLMMMGVWLWSSGMSGWLVVPMLVVTFLLMLGITRIVAEGGLAITRVPMVPGDVLLTSMGSSTLGASNLAALGMTLPWAGEMRTSAMAAFIHGLKLAEIHVRGERRRLVLAAFLAIGTSVACAVVTILVLGYRYGGVNLSSWFFGRSGGMVYDFIAHHLNNIRSTSWASWGFAAIGAAVQLLLTSAYHRFIWWPIHPLIFPVGAIWCTHQMIPAIFVAWAIKSAMLHYGGVRLYRAAKPLFLGLILGQYMSGGIWILIDRLTGMQANYLFYW